MGDSRATPVHAWVILSIAVLAVSSAGAIFKMMGDITPILRASWRLQATSIVLFPLFIWQLRTTEFYLAEIYNLDYSRIWDLPLDPFCQLGLVS